jgi:hypothetical protein
VIISTSGNSEEAYHRRLSDRFTIQQEWALRIHDLASGPSEHKCRSRNPLPESSQVGKAGSPLGSPPLDSLRYQFSSQNSPPDPHRSGRMLQLRLTPRPAPPNELCPSLQTLRPSDRRSLAELQPNTPRRPCSRPPGLLPSPDRHIKATIRLLPIARQTDRVAGTEDQGRLDAVNNVEDFLATFD